MTPIQQGSIMSPFTFQKSKSLWLSLQFGPVAEIALFIMGRHHVKSIIFFLRHHPKIPSHPTQMEGGPPAQIIFDL